MGQARQFGPEKMDMGWRNTGSSHDRPGYDPRSSATNHSPNMKGDAIPGTNRASLHSQANITICQFDT